MPGSVPVASKGSRRAPRHKKVLNSRFPNVVDVIASLDGDFVLDGELVALIHKVFLRSKFYKAVFRRITIYFYAFDLLNQNGELIVNLPFSRRRELLESLLAAPEDPLRLSPLFHAQSDPGS
jgi:ATP-dependent DNA ligase